MDTPSSRMQDLNDLRLYAAVVEHGGFSAAGRALRMPKSRLSKRVALLEERLGVRLLQRTTRRFAVTPVGERYYAHCRAMLEAAQAAQDAVDELRTEPHGLVRMSCPVALAQTMLRRIVPEFLATYPKVRLQVLASNRRVDLIGEGYDIAVRVRDRIDTDAELVARNLGRERRVLVASPAFLRTHGRPEAPPALASLPTLSYLEHDTAQVWDLRNAQDERAKVEVQARLVCGDFQLLVGATLAGLGIALLPVSACSAELDRGELEVVLPEWSAPYGILHLVYPSRRGLLPAVRALIDDLAEKLPSYLRHLAACEEAAQA